jgi:hypoxanthine phosphoribosyltransferase
MEKKKKYLGIEEYHYLIKELCERIPKNVYDAIYGIPRGGSIIATYMSHYLNDLEVLPVISYPYHFRYNILVVDDICDTGRTLIHFWSKFDTACIFWKGCKIKPKYWVEQIPKKVWIVFPYERTDAIPNR